MGAYKRNVVVVIKMGAYIYGVFILCGCLFCVGAYYPDFMVFTLFLCLGCNSKSVTIYLLQLFSLERVQYKLKGN